MSDDMASVDFRNVTKKFGDVVAVNNVNFKAKDKEFLTGEITS